MDANPVTPLHVMFIPKRHAETYFDLTRDEKLAIDELMTQVKDDLLKQDATITGFNIGMNCGKDAGQTVFHCHVHLFPRRPGDHPDPRGGIRHMMPGKGHY
jgi:diadenosine tetraphosphate (Ap4A) HIT family hydrolase